MNGQTFLNDFVESDSGDNNSAKLGEKLRKLSWIVREFDSKSQIIILETRTLRHEMVVTEFSRLLDIKAAEMNLRDQLLWTGSAGRALKRNQTTIVKEPDQSFRPKSIPHSRSKQYPAVVLQAAYTESRSQLERDMALWIEGSNGDVKMAIGAFVNPGSKTITIEGWELTEGPTNANLWPRMAATQTQKMQISQEGQEPTITGSFSIKFDHLFLRSPQIAAEKDIVITTDELKKIAERVWDIYEWS